MTVPAAEVRGLVRTYPPSRRTSTARTALDAVDLTVPVGEVHGLLGPNGAGKTTLCRILSTVLLPTSGVALVHGVDVARHPDRVRPMVGLAFGGERGLYTRLSGRRNLRFWAGLYRVPRTEAKRRVDELLERVGLTERADDRVETYSLGMKQRLHVARSLVGDPRVVILDEPTNGLDPVATREVRALVHELRDEGRTVLLTTHDMAEAEALCDRVSLLDGGRLLRTESPRTLGGWLSAYERIDATGVPPQVAATLAGVHGVTEVERTNAETLRVHVSSTSATRQVLHLLLEAGVTSMATSRPSLEEVYLHLFGQKKLRV
ncbi:ABC-2 type transport system ATP-binding protein [Micromonospora sediminicola]|uniref:ABC-2 type transport system ATP-binding protein n=1 Tax=Micromonospora sediminicola TaxID=946078 RepID=A0A1A9B3I6_9ACTN|nr:MULTISPECIES: ABC transporter ATP-binding protein [Micromonospora]PGH41751.1 ABC transporter ATP-binding protein [Micromonospora sp. WMMA1996]SBT63683.1 ABC-2 type transport system ATP-binding protein [Micromonospora sediminicola]